MMLQNAIDEELNMTSKLSPLRSQTDDEENEGPRLNISKLVLVNNVTSHEWKRSTPLKTYSKKNSMSTNMAAVSRYGRSHKPRIADDFLSTDKKVSQYLKIDADNQLHYFKSSPYAVYKNPISKQQASPTTTTTVPTVTTSTTVTSSGDAATGNPCASSTPAPRKRGRPRKIPLPDSPISMNSSSIPPDTSLSGDSLSHSSRSTKVSSASSLHRACSSITRSGSAVLKGGKSQAAAKPVTVAVDNLQMTTTTELNVPLPTSTETLPIPPELMDQAILQGVSDLDDQEDTLPDIPEVSSSETQPATTTIDDSNTSVDSMPAAYTSGTEVEIGPDGEPKWMVGDLAWACVGGFPYWPCTVTRDPFENAFTKLKFVGKFRHAKDQIHVRFFGDHGRRSWIHGSYILPFLGLDNFLALAEQKCTPKIKKKFPKIYKSFTVTPGVRKAWQAAVSEAESLREAPRSDRVKYFVETFPPPSLSRSEKRRQSLQQLPSSKDKSKSPSGSATTAKKRKSDSVLAESMSKKFKGEEITIKIEPESDDDLMEDPDFKQMISQETSSAPEKRFIIAKAKMRKGNGKNTPIITSLNQPDLVMCLAPLKIKKEPPSPTKSSSPAPSVDSPVKRGRGRPRKYPRLDELVKESATLASTPATPIATVGKKKYTKKSLNNTASDGEHQRNGNGEKKLLQQVVVKEEFPSAEVVAEGVEPSNERKRSSKLGPGYSSFYDKHFDQVSDEDPSLTPAEVKKYLEKMWSQLSDAVKARYRSKTRAESQEVCSESSEVETDSIRSPTQNAASGNSSKPAKRGISLFSGVKSDKVCSVCFKGNEPGEVVKCKGPCCNYFHLECSTLPRYQRSKLTITNKVPPKKKNKRGRPRIVRNEEKTENSSSETSSSVAVEKTIDEVTNKDGDLVVKDVETSAQPAASVEHQPKQENTPVDEEQKSVVATEEDSLNASRTEESNSSKCNVSDNGNQLFESLSLTRGNAVTNNESAAKDQVSTEKDEDGAEESKSVNENTEVNKLPVEPPHEGTTLSTLAELGKTNLDDSAGKDEGHTEVASDNSVGVDGMKAKDSDALKSAEDEKSIESKMVDEVTEKAEEITGENSEKEATAQECEVTTQETDTQDDDCEERADGEKADWEEIIDLTEECSKVTSEEEESSVITQPASSGMALDGIIEIKDEHGAGAEHQLGPLIHFKSDLKRELSNDDKNSIDSDKSNDKQSIDSDKGQTNKGWICGLCAEGKDGPCFICGLDTGSLVRCSTSHCGKVYHMKCLTSWPQMQVGQTAKGKLVLYCPQHSCHTCISDNPAAHTARFSYDKFVRCVACPTSYHYGNHCIPAGSELLSTTQIVCPRHYKPLKESLIHINASWCSLCAVGGSLICCDTCPNSFHAECLKIEPPEGSFICEDCETGRIPLYGEVVWVKLGAYRWWPAKILYPFEVPENIRTMNHSPVGEFVVEFFGSHDYFWINRGRAFFFHEGDGGSIPCKSRTDELFVTGMIEATEAFRQYQSQRESREAYCRPSMKPPKYVKIQTNRPYGTLRSAETDVASMTACECDPEKDSPCGRSSDCINRLLMVECNPQICPAGEKCHNQNFEKRLYPPLLPFRTETRGWGLKTLVSLKKGDFVIEYVGEMIDEEEYKKRVISKQKNKDENYYFLTIDKDRMLDAGPKGNMARFMNHSCNPNCETQKWTVNGDTRVGLFALMDIAADSELVFNYNLETIGNTRVDCKCGAPFCGGYIGAKVTKHDEKKATTNSTSNKKKKQTKKSVSSNSAAATGGTPAASNASTAAAKVTTTKITEHRCFTCGEGGELMYCDHSSCPKAYHLVCLGLTKHPSGNWECPRHICSICSSTKVQTCTHCINSYCDKHAEGNITTNKNHGVVCFNCTQSESGSDWSGEQSAEEDDESTASAAVAGSGNGNTSRKQQQNLTETVPPPPSASSSNTSSTSSSPVTRTYSNTKLLRQQPVRGRGRPPMLNGGNTH